MSLFAPENLVSRDGFGSPVPRQPSHLHTQAESGAYLRDSSRFLWRRPFIYLNRHTPSGQSPICRVMQLRTDGVHCRESAGTGPVNLKVVSNGCCHWQVTMDELIRASLSHTHHWYEVGMLKVPVCTSVSKRARAGLALAQGTTKRCLRVETSRPLVVLVANPHTPFLRRLAQFFHERSSASATFALLRKTCECWGLLHAERPHKRSTGMSFVNPSVLLRTSSGAEEVICEAVV